MKTKSKKLTGTELDGLEGDPKEGSNNMLYGILALVGLGGIAWYFLQPKNPRTPEQTSSLRTSLQNMYKMHGQTIDGAKLDAVLNEYLTLEKSVHSYDALKTIETRLSETSHKGLIYGEEFGLYGVPLMHY